MKRNIAISLVLIFVVVSYLFFDRSVALYFHGHDFYESIFQVITEFGRAEFYLVPAALLYLLYWKRGGAIRRGAALVFLSVAVSGILVNILKILFGRCRPKMLFAQDLFGFSWCKVGYSYASFPSGHSTTVFSAYIALALLFPKQRYLFYALALVIAISRVIVGAHYPSDVAAGALLGSLTAITLNERMTQADHG